MESRRSPVALPACVRRREHGAALLLALLSLSLLSAVAMVVLLSASSEALIAGAFRDQRAGTYAADAILARAVDEFAALPDWPTVLAAPSAALADGPPTGTRTLADGSTIDLQQVVNTAACQKPTACTVTELDAVTSRRPWGATNPRWQLYAYGALASMLPLAGDDMPWYVVLMVADDPVRADNTIVIRAEAFGPRNGHAVVEARAARPASGDTDYNDGESALPVHILAWREVR
jgi:hypothetical protein